MLLLWPQNLCLTRIGNRTVWYELFLTDSCWQLHTKLSLITVLWEKIFCTQRNYYLLWGFLKLPLIAVMITLLMLPDLRILLWASQVNPYFLYQMTICETQISFLSEAIFLDLPVDEHLVMWPQMDFKCRRQIVRSQWWLSVFKISWFWETWDVSQHDIWYGCHDTHKFKRQCYRKLYPPCLAFFMKKVF